MASKCWCKTAKEDIDKAYKNPNPYYGALQDIMDAEIDYAKDVCDLPMSQEASRAWRGHSRA